MIAFDDRLFNGNERKYIAETLAAGQFGADGGFVAQFEKLAAQNFSRQFAVAVNSPAAAIETSLFALGIRPGDRVFLPAICPASLAFAIIRLGAIPLTVDVKTENWTLDCEQVSRVIARGETRNAAVLVWHFGGNPVDLDPLIAAQAKFSLTILEFCGTAIGAEYGARQLTADDGLTWKKCGAFGAAAAVEFPGGATAIVADREEVAERARSYRDIDQELNPPIEQGYDFCPTNLAAAIGAARLEQTTELAAKQRQIAAWYQEGLKEIGAARLATVAPNANPSGTIIAIEINRDCGKTATSIIADLTTHQIAARRFPIGLHAHPALRYLLETLDGGYPVADAVREYGVLLPSGDSLTRQQVYTVCEVLRNLLRR